MDTEITPEMKKSMMNSLGEKFSDPSMEMYFDKEQLDALKADAGSLTEDMDMKTIMTKMKQLEE